MIEGASRLNWDRTLIGSVTVDRPERGFQVILSTRYIVILFHFRAERCKKYALYQKILQIKVVHN